MDNDDTPVKWQPVMLVTQGRIECDCGALAVFVILDGAPNRIEEWNYSAWCQQCFEREQEQVYGR